MPGYTVVKCAGGTRVALFEWKEHPLVEVRGTVIVPKQETRSWLRLSRDRKYRTMTIGETRYIWTPDKGHINLHSSGGSPQLLGRISRGENTVIIEVAKEAIDRGLLDPIVTAAFLLQCGHSID
ncbi:hypothetical protein GGX14DRAFT_449114 [Mycena pura]|uniref:Uncharacterized protein n=1 Tax=Mycena pura TaxID=153505 RepID=A0AAD6VH42_9AGAR|nr:hypothetical protein GGX14DRAFT_449114 [Mycena pura]